MFPITFVSPWVLLLLIPALGFTLWPYFRLSKKYRRTRNRIISMILHMTVILLSVCVLAGLTYHYDEPNLRNEIIVLVDISYSNKAVEGDKDDFVKEIIDNTKKEFKVGIITFGYGEPIYAAELSYNTTEHFRKYRMAVDVDDSGTDIAAALRFAATKFSDPQSGKIVLITDGLETDGSALDVILNLATQGIKVDSVCFSKESSDKEVQISSIKLPDYNVAKGDTADIIFTLDSNFSGDAKVKLLDGGAEYGPFPIPLSVGTQEITLSHVFEDYGLHQITLRLESTGDVLSQNNSYYSYLFMEKYDKVLILERSSNESYSLEEILKDGEYQTEIRNIANAPKTLSELREYDEVVLVNIANADMPDGFDSILNTYVRQLGGGLFTVGGDKTSNGEVSQNTYSMTDMYDKGVETLYQQMLPVQSINYTPPLGVVLVLDRSGSMEQDAGIGTGETRIELVKRGAVDCIKVLNERDYVGIITFAMTPKEVIKITPVTERQAILNSITGIKAGGDTEFSGAIEMASRALQSLGNVEKKHIIFLSDGDPLAGERSFITLIEDYNRSAGITVSVLSIGASSTGIALCRDMAAAGKGNYYNIQASNIGDVPRLMAQDVKMPDITTYIPEPFTPVIKDITKVVKNVTASNIPGLGGFYGTKPRAEIEIPLMGEYVPVYAQWKYGEGRVGSFMSNLSGGEWGRGFLNNETGRLIITNIIQALLPFQSIREQEIEVKYKDDNYKTYLDITSKMEEGQYFEVSAINLDTSSVPFETAKPPVVGNLAQMVYEIQEPGIYKITIEKKDAQGALVSETSYYSYRTFSYSQEYNMFRDLKDGEDLVQQLAENANGTFLESSEAAKVFNELEFAIPRTHTPQIEFMLIAILLLLLDIAVRKFKFKWPHEIYRDYKTKKELKLGIH